jgi:hypothetical protein
MVSGKAQFRVVLTMQEGVNTRGQLHGAWISH